MSRSGHALRFGILALLLGGCGGGQSPAGLDATLDAAMGPEAGPDGATWPPRIRELCGTRDPEATLEPGVLTRGVQEAIAGTSLPLVPEDQAAAGFAPPHPFRLERLRLRLTGRGAVTVAVWGDYMREEPDPDVVLVQEQWVDVNGEAWYVVEGFPSPVFDPAERFWVVVTFQDAGLDWLVGAAPGGWDRFRLPGRVDPPVEWEHGPDTIALAVHAEGSFLCPVQETWFVDRRGESGLAGTDHWFLQIADLDGDGDDDFLGLLGDQLAWYRNLGGLRFERADLRTTPWDYLFVLAADVDNDGDQDVYLGLYDPPGGTDPGARPQLLLNDGDGGLTERTDSGLEIRGAGAVGAFADYDGDGHLDLYVGTLEQEAGVWQSDQLFRGNGDGTFTEDAAGAGLQALPAGPGFGVTWCDLDDDGWPDLLVAESNSVPNRVWHNNGDGTFTEIGEDLGLDQDDVGGVAGFSMMMECGDYDNDGRLDLLVGENTWAYLPEVDPPRLMHQVTGGPAGLRFEDVTAAAGLPPAESMFDPTWVDVDNDGDLDLFVCSEGVPTQAAQLYRNNGDGTFTDVTYEAGLAIWEGVVGAWSDFDGDGDLDLLAYSRTRATLLLYENRLGPGPRWIQLRLQGVAPSNRDALGARLTATTGDLLQVREVSGTWGSRINNSSRVVHFGFGDHTEPLEITIRWPSGRVERFTDLPENARSTVVEGSGEPAD